MHILSSVDFWTVFAPVFASVLTVVVGWYFNEHSKRANERARLAWDQYERRRKRYEKLLRTSRGFYVSTQDTRLKDAFLEQLKLCWLDAPDEVIKSAYAFLDTVHTEASSSEAVRERAFGEFVAAIRRDLLSPKATTETKLGAGDFKHLRAN